MTNPRVVSSHIKVQIRTDKHGDPVMYIHCRLCDWVKDYSSPRVSLKQIYEDGRTHEAEKRKKAYDEKMKIEGCFHCNHAFGVHVPPAGLALEATTLDDFACKTRLCQCAHFKAKEVLVAA